MEAHSLLQRFNRIPRDLLPAAQNLTTHLSDFFELAWLANGWIGCWSWAELADASGTL